MYSQIALSQLLTLRRQRVVLLLLLDQFTLARSKSMRYTKVLLGSPLTVV